MMSIMLNHISHLPVFQIVLDLLSFLHLQKTISPGVYNYCFYYEKYDYERQYEKNQKYQNIETFTVVPELTQFSHHDRFSILFSIYLYT